MGCCGIDEQEESETHCKNEGVSRVFTALIVAVGLLAAGSAVAGVWGIASHLSKDQKVVARR